MEYQRPPVPSQILRLSPRPVFLAGREELLANLHARLYGDADTGPQLAALCGLGGCGKTSVAVEYAHRHLAGFAIVWQFSAEEPAALAAGFGDLAAQLGAREMRDAGDRVAQAHAALAAHPLDWLLIFDNAPSLAAIRHVLPPAGKGRVLVTSQDPHWPGGRVQEVPVLDRDVASGFLQARTGSAELDEAAALATELGGLPLALEQAAAYMLATGSGVGAYLNLFRRRRRDLLTRGEPHGYGKQVASTWSMALDQLRRFAPTAIGLLRLLACCAPDQIPLDLLLRPPSDPPGTLPAELELLLDDPLAAADALAALRRFSLVSAPHDGFVSVHRLVQAITLDQLDDREVGIWQQAARSVIEAALPDDPERPETWPTYAALLPHAGVVLQTESQGMARIANYLGETGDYTAAREMLEKIAVAREHVLGPEHPGTLTVRADVASWTGATGNLAAARDQFAVLLPVCERVCGPEHPDTLAARRHLARWTGDAGNPAAARDQFAALLPLLRRVLGNDHPDVLNARIDVAHWTGATGDRAAARDQFAALLPDYERVLGGSHPTTLSVRKYLAHWIGVTGDPAAARDLLAALLPDYERVLGGGHPSTLIASADLALWIGAAGSPAVARGRLAALLPVLERTLGSDAPDVLTARVYLAGGTAATGQMAASLDQWASLLPPLERVFGPEHPDTLAVRVHMAACTGAAGDPATAHGLLTTALPVIERVLGPSSPLALTTRAHLARFSQLAEDPAQRE